MKYTSLLMLTCIVTLSVQARQGSSFSKNSAKNSPTQIDTAQTESSFPGGDVAWAKFLGQHLTYPEKAVRKNIQGTVVVQFIVDKDGSISDIKALSGPDLLRPAAVDVLQYSPRWKPAFQYGKKVKSYKVQPITFKLEH